MSLRLQAESDLAQTLEATLDFGWPVVVTDPSGNSGNLNCQTGDIGLTVDPDTGLPISGRLAHCSMRISTLVSEGFTDLPKGISNTNLKPWLVTFDDINGNTFSYKVKQSMPDRTIGIVTCILEHWKELP